MIGALASSLDSANSALSTSINRLASGSRINSAQDDASGSAIASRLSVQISSTGAALNNISNGLSITQTAAGGLGQVSDTLQRLRELAVQSANGTNNTSDRLALQAEFSQISSSLDNVSGQLQFNGQNLLDGSLNTTLQTGPNSGDTQNLSLGSVSSAGLGIASLDISTENGSSSALAAIDQALSSVGNQQASIGAIQASLEAASSNLTSGGINLSATRSSIADTDYAAESGTFALAKVKQQASLKAIALYNANQAQTLNLLPGPNK